MTGANEISGAASDTTSLSSSVSKYRYENGRRYHGYKDGLYLSVAPILINNFHPKFATISLYRIQGSRMMRSSLAFKILGKFYSCYIQLTLALRDSHHMLLLLLENKLHLAPIVENPQVS
jgi:hypothetical protein